MSNDKENIYKEKLPTLGEVVSTGLLDNTFDIGIDYSDLALDSFLDEGILKEIPIAKSLVSIFKIGRSVKAMSFTKKFMIFLSHFHSFNIDENKIEDFKEKFKDDNSFKENVIENLIVLIDRVDSQLKAKILANLFLAFINKEYDWDTFLDLSACVDRLLIIDLKLLKYLKNAKDGEQIFKIYIDSADEFIIFASTERLKSYGFLDDDRKYGNKVKPPIEAKVLLSRYGIKFYELCLKGLI